MTRQTALDRWVKRSVGPGSQNDSRPASTAQDESEDHEDRITTTPSSQTAYNSDDGHTLAQSSVISSCQHPSVRFQHPEKKHIAGLKRLNSLLLPIPYPESFYREIISDPIAQSLTLLAFWHPSERENDHVESSGQLVGAIRCRLLNEACGAARKEGSMLYLSTLVLLSPYRGHGIASSMLDAVLKYAVETHKVTTIGAHVWEANEPALKWYANRGFTERHYEPEYYRKLKPHGAKVMTKDVSVLDLIPQKQAWEGHS